MKKILNKRLNTGITLIALVITIIILLILAGITIAQLSNSGLFNKAQEAKEKWNNAEKSEEEKISQYNNEIDSYVSGDRDTITIPKEEYDRLLKSSNTNNYSETEQVIGTWENGKPLYQRIVKFKSPSALATWTNVYTVQGANYVRMVYGEIERSDTFYGKMVLNYYTTAVTSINNNVIKMYVNEPEFANQNVLLVIQYTKTTD